MQKAENNKKITFSWWNTSMSPHSKENTASDEHKYYVLYILARLFIEKDVDVLCLCEVSEKDIAYINEQLDLKSLNYNIYNGALRDGRKKFDVCVIYRASILTLIGSDIISKMQITRKIHAAQQVNFIINETAEPIAIYLVHWSSRLYDYPDSPNKIQLGSLLRDAVDICRDSKNIKHVVILGDFNDEPYNQSLTDSLFASRDISLVQKLPKLLYNPFWRHMSHRTLHPFNSSDEKGCGTYFYKSDQSNRWKTFDQIIFSSDFISGKSWYLNEEKTEVFGDKQLIDYVYNSKSKFDHLPIISVIEKV
ncbi:endonuclease/exonuclease/phosphatase family protein [Enterobacter ludwigii]|uniref:endonuclease/exonuclease/phosphatase family protein n=1 Tax=Enterobacter ludwigii TaxID=299767 RepID=UPI002A7FD4D6|nr:endonuclease/exonuclease/phosphatase family protein [Enterobacter ludwigii]